MFHGLRQPAKIGQHGTKLGAQSMELLETLAIAILAACVERDTLELALANPAKGWQGSQSYYAPVLIAAYFMWDRSYRWQRHIRLAAGLGVLLSLMVASMLLARTSAANRTQEGARNLAGELLWPSRQMIEVQVPAELRTQVGTLVYREREDGIAQVIGRVVAVGPEDHGQVRLAIRLSAMNTDISHRGGILKGAPAALSLRDAVQLLVSPNMPSEEAMMARDMIWPSIRTYVLPEIADGLIREISADLADPGPEDAELLKRLVENLHQAIEPLENDLVERLARRAWDIVGAQGLASGALRAKLNDAKAKGASVADWLSRLIGNEEKADSTDRPFLSEKTSQALKAALEEEALEFWKDNRAQIVEAFKNAVGERRQDFELAVKDRWSGALYERVIAPAWQTGQVKVIESIENYVRDFARRCLLTNQGGPRLLFAYVLRSYLDISVAPLLVLAPPADGHTDQVIYEALLR